MKQPHLMVAAASLVALSACAASNNSTGVDYLPSWQPPIIHRRGKFKPNQRKQKKGKK